MIIAFVEDGTVSVLEDIEAVRRDFEAIDVESETVVFYRDDGTWLEPKFTVPNKRSFFGWIVTPGKFDLVPNASPPPQIDRFDAALDEAVALNPNSHFDSIEAIRKHVQAQRGRNR